MRHLTAKLTRDELSEASSVARKRCAARVPPGSPEEITVERRIATAEKAVALALHRPWDGAFTKVSSWKIWGRLDVAVRRIIVVPTSEAMGALCLPEDVALDVAIVLVSDRDAPKLALTGWLLGRDAQKDDYVRIDDGKRTRAVPHDALRSAMELKREPRSTRGRLSPSDPADDFGGTGAFPGMLDTDEGRPPEKVSPLFPARWPLPCRRCQTVVPIGALTAWSVRTGWIHGTKTECNARAR